MVELLSASQSSQNNSLLVKTCTPAFRRPIGGALCFLTQQKSRSRERNESRGEKSRHRSWSLILLSDFAVWRSLRLLCYVEQKVARIFPEMGLQCVVTECSIIDLPSSFFLLLWDTSCWLQDSSDRTCSSSRTWAHM